MNPTFKKGDQVTTKLDGDGVIVKCKIHLWSHRHYSYRVKLDNPDRHGNIEIDKFPCDLEHRVMEK